MDNLINLHSTMVLFKYTTAQTQKILDAICQNKIEAQAQRINQLELLKSEVGTHLLDLGVDVETKITDKVYKDYFDEMKRQAGILKATTSNNIWASPAVIDSATANIAVGAFSKNIWANIDNLKARLDGLLATAMIRGDNPKEMVKYLKPLVEQDNKHALANVLLDYFKHIEELDKSYLPEDSLLHEFLG